MEHKLGTSAVDLPTPGGMILHGLSVQCGGCKKAFVVESRYVIKLGASIYDIKDTKFISCPYCGTTAPTKADRNFLTDTRPIGDD